MENNSAANEQEANVIAEAIYGLQRSGIAAEVSIFTGNLNQFKESLHVAGRSLEVLTNALNKAAKNRDKQGELTTGTPEGGTEGGDKQ